MPDPRLHLRRSALAAAVVAAMALLSTPGASPFTPAVDSEMNT